MEMTGITIANGASETNINATELQATQITAAHPMKLGVNDFATDNKCTQNVIDFAAPTNPPTPVPYAPTLMSMKRIQKGQHSSLLSRRSDFLLSAISVQDASTPSIADSRAKRPSRLLKKYNVSEHMPTNEVSSAAQPNTFDMNVITPFNGSRMRRIMTDDDDDDDDSEGNSDSSSSSSIDNENQTGDEETKDDENDKEGDDEDRHAREKGARGLVMTRMGARAKAKKEGRRRSSWKDLIGRVWRRTSSTSTSTLATVAMNTKQPSGEAIHSGSEV